jgi:voltage-gated potassium channel
MLLLGSWMAYTAEKPTNPGFATFADSLWWGIVTLTTVGYGDIVPQTEKGRMAGVFLMITGLASLGVLSGTMASFFRSSSSRAEAAPDPPAPADPEELDDVRRQLAAIADRLAAR